MGGSFGFERSLGTLGVVICPLIAVAWFGNDDVWPRSCGASHTSAIEAQCYHPANLGGNY